MNTPHPKQISLSLLIIAAFVLIALSVAGLFAIFNEIGAITLRCLGASANDPTCTPPALLIYGAPLAGLVGLVLLVVALVLARRARSAGKVKLGRPFAIGIIIVATATAIALFVGNSNPTTDKPNAAASVSAETVATKTPGVAGGHADHAADDRTASPAARHPFPEVPTTRNGLELESDPFLASSVEEQAWLDRNGYPNNEQWSALLTASDMQLMAAAQAGDVAAAALHAQRRLIAGDETAIDDMIELGAKGSIFSLELLSSALAGPRADPVMGYALSRVVEMRGNYRVALGRDMMFSTPLNASQRLDAEQLAMEFYSRIEAIQRQTGDSSHPTVDPRPLHGDPSP